MAALISAIYGLILDLPVPAAGLVARTESPLPSFHNEHRVCVRLRQLPQWVARIDHGLSSLRLERVFLGRHKFTHFRVWYRDALANYIREMLLDSRTLSRPYIQRDTLERLVEGHLKGESQLHNGDPQDSDLGAFAPAVF